jgi:hypothetical protein
MAIVGVCVKLASDWLTNFTFLFPPGHHKENVLKEGKFFTFRERRNFISIFPELIKKSFFLSRVVVCQFFLSISFNYVNIKIA